MKARLMILSAFAALPMLASAAAFTPAELDKAVASLPKANVMGGFAVHSKQFCGSCHGPNGIAPTANWPHVAGQPFEVTAKALLDYRDGRRTGGAQAAIMTAAAKRLTDQQIADVSALYEMLPGPDGKTFDVGKKGRTPVEGVDVAMKYFEWSNMGIILAIKGADFLEASGLPIPVVLVLFIIMCALINMLIGGASTKWAILSPIFVPMFMFLGYHPALAQMAYRIGDSITNPICPTFAYFGMLLALSQKYDKNAGFGTLMANMLPYTIAFFCFMTIQLLIWFILGIPFGPGAPLRLS